MSRERDKWGRYEAKRLRVTVSRWDADHIWAIPSSGGEERRICYGRANEYLSRGGKGDWSYLADILSEGAQLNLVRVRMRGDDLFPELIIYEPDYLINITTVASCFELYAESPFVSLVNKIKPRANTMPIHLGNLAGEFLDDTVHQRDTTFEEALRRFISRNSLEMVACPEMRDHAAFHRFTSDARLQKANIERLIGQDLPAAIDGYSRDRVLLEPSFLSELLGIQGRMDFLHEDPEGNMLIIEQKSGKGGFPPSADPEVPVPQEKHLVQLLLYRALFAYGFDRYAEQMRHIMLLYSKYAKGLVDVASHPELLVRAFRMRNLLAWCELQYTREEGFRRLRTLTPEQLNRKGLGGRLWDGYIRPQLQALLQPIGQASPLEQEYYLRFLRFIATEQMLSKLGNGTEETPGFASAWRLSLQEKREAGTILDGLSPIPATTLSPATAPALSPATATATALSPAPAPASTLAFRLPPHTATDGVGTFRPGDIVMLYPYRRGGTPDACAQMVERASIAGISETEITLRLRSNARPASGETATRQGETTTRKTTTRGATTGDTGDETLWAIEHDQFEASTGALYSAMHAFLAAPQERRDLILCQRPPRIDTTVGLRGDYGAMNTLVRQARQSRDMFLVIGPPGTGKTSLGLVSLLEEELLEEGTNVLLLSYTNRAVDEICSKLEQGGHQYIRIGSELSCPEAYRRHLLTRQTAECPSGQDVARLLRSTRIVCGTAASLNAAMPLFDIKRFSLAIIDEASQILEPHLLGLLSARQGQAPAIGRFVLIGDHKQLPAVVQQTEEQSRVKEERLRAIGLTDCRRSLFERMLATHSGTPIIYMLTRQGRMHPDVAEFPNLAFYGGKLQAVPLPHQLKTGSCQYGDRGYRVSFQCVSDTGGRSMPKTNLAEARLMAQRVREIYEATRPAFSPDTTVGVIVPYRNQIATVRAAIDEYGIPALHGITIDTVERYQGSQRDYILYGFTVRERYQLAFLGGSTFEEDGVLIDRKLNVAMTRARLRLMLFGNPDILKHNPVFLRLMDFLREKGALS